MTESELIKALQQKSEIAFRLLVQTYERMIYNTVLGIVQHEQEAEDIAQEVFIQVYTSISGFREDAKLSTWMYRIATSKSLDWERKKKAKKRIGTLLQIFGASEDVEYEVPDFNHPGVVLEQKENAAMIFKAIKLLPENQRVAFILIKTEGLSYQETSEIMGASVKAVESYMHRAKQRLQKMFNNDQSIIR